MLIDWVDVATRLVCRARGHRWEPFKMKRAQDLTMRYGRREFCMTCSANRIVFADGDELVVPGSEVVDLSPRWLEGLYRARWGELPRQRVIRGGAIPMEWQW